MLRDPVEMHDADDLFALCAITRTTMQRIEKNLPSWNPCKLKDTPVLNVLIADIHASTSCNFPSQAHEYATDAK